MKTLIMAAAVTLALAGGASAATFAVPGTADPWLANATVDDNYPGVTTPDYAPAESPVFAGFVTAGSTLSWNASGLVAHWAGDLPGAGPNGESFDIEGRVTGLGNNGIPNITAPMDSLLGVFTGSSDTIFIMGSSGNVTIPAGATEFFMGTMDSYQWWNNLGRFQVQVSGVPDGGLTIATLGIVISGLAFIRRKL